MVRGFLAIAAASAVDCRGAACLGAGAASGAARSLCRRGDAAIGNAGTRRGGGQWRRCADRPGLRRATAGAARAGRRGYRLQHRLAGQVLHRGRARRLWSTRAGSAGTIRSHRWLPQVRFSDPWLTEHVTLGDLLSHRTGLQPANTMWRLTHIDRAEILRRVRYLEPASPFRTEQVYNNALYVVAGEVTAAAAGMSWEELIRTRLLRPLGMARTTAGVAPPIERQCRQPACGDRRRAAAGPAMHPSSPSRRRAESIRPRGT